VIFYVPLSFVLVLLLETTVFSYMVVPGGVDSQLDSEKHIHNLKVALKWSKSKFRNSSPGTDPAR